MYIMLSQNQQPTIILYQFQFQFNLVILSCALSVIIFLPFMKTFIYMSKALDHNTKNLVVNTTVIRDFCLWNE